MAKTESEVKLILTEKEKNNLKSSLDKLTQQKIGFQRNLLDEDELKIVDYIKNEM